MKHVVLWCVLTLSLSMAAPSLHAQEEQVEIPAGTEAMYQTMIGGGFRQTMAEASPIMTRSDVQRYSEILGLDERQRETAAVLLAAYQLQMEVLRASLRDDWNALRSKMQREDPSKFNGMAAMRELLLDHRKRKGELDAGFMRDLRSILIPEQEANWERFERTHRREKRLRFAYMSGERADLVAIAAGLKWDSPELSRVLEAYAEELDRAIVNRERVRAQVLERSRGMNYDAGEKDVALVTSVMAEVRGAGMRVRDVNRKYARQVLEILPEEQGRTFARTIEIASFPEIYRPTLAERAVVAALTFEDLEERQRREIEDLRQRLEAELAANSEQLVRATEQAEETFTPADIPTDPYGVERLRKERRARSDAAYERLKGLLNSEQRERLPKPEPR